MPTATPAKAFWSAEEARVWQAIDATGFDDGSDFRLESLLGPFCADWPSSEAATRFCRCDTDDLEIFRAQLAHPRRRVVAKLLIFATREVPERLLEDVVRAGVQTGNPSFAKHYLWPCVLARGLAATVTAVDVIAHKEGLDVQTARYWLEVPRADICWPHLP